MCALCALVPRLADPSSEVLSVCPTGALLHNKMSSALNKGTDIFLNGQTLLYINIYTYILRHVSLKHRWEVNAVILSKFLSTARKKIFKPLSHVFRML